MQVAASIKEFGFDDWRFCIENDCYVVTSHGDVLRVCRRQYSRAGNLISNYETILLRGSIDKFGYRTYRMLINGLKKHAKGHRLVLNAFCGIEPQKSANHKNGIKTDNSIQNLEWVTAAENNIHAINTGLWKMFKGINQKIHPSNYATIYILVKDFGFKRQQIAKLNYVSRQTIDTIVNRIDSLISFKSTK